MKKLMGIVLAMMILFACAALADDLSSLTDEELTALQSDVNAEMVRRGLAEGIPATAEDDAFVKRVIGFFSFWSVNDLDGMTDYCDPDWKAAQENSRTALFAILANRTPLTAEVVQLFDEAGGTRRIDMDSLIDRHNGKDPEHYRLSLLMKKAEDGEWYLDPECLRTYELVELPPEEQTEEESLMNTLLSYVPNGGEKYHLDQNCPAVNEKYLPMEDCFAYWELNMDEYKDLEPCNVCGAPSREKAPTDLPYFLLKIYDRSGIEKVSYLRTDYYVGDEYRGFCCSCPNEGEDFFRFPLGADSLEELKDLRVEFSYGVSDLAPEDAILEVMKGTAMEEHPLLTMDFVPEGGKTYRLSLEPDGADGWKLVPAEEE